jgi:hypothetical protein
MTLVTLKAAAQLKLLFNKLASQAELFNIEVGLKQHNKQ